MHPQQNEGRSLVTNGPQYDAPAVVYQPRPNGSTYTIHDAADLLGVTPGRLEAMVRRGELQASRTRLSWQIPIGEVLRLQAAGWFNRSPLKFVFAEQVALYLAHRLTTWSPPGEDFAAFLGDLTPLVESIRRRGLLVPVVATTDERVILGRRRFEAARLAGLDLVPVIAVKVRTDSPRFAELVADLLLQGGDW